MPCRYVISPVVIGADGVRRPKVETLSDPGRGIGYDTANAIGGGLQGEVNDWALSFVRGVDLTPLDADPDIVDVLDIGDIADADIAALLDKSATLALNPAKRTRLRTTLEDHGADLKGLTDDHPVADWLGRIVERFAPGADARQLRVG